MDSISTSVNEKFVWRKSREDRIAGLKYSVVKQNHLTIHPDDRLSFSKAGQYNLTFRVSDLNNPESFRDCDWCKVDVE